MKALILAAGYATRLYPLTLNTPKPLLKLKGRPILDYIIDKLEQIEELGQIYIVTNNKFYPQFETWLSQFPLSPQFPPPEGGRAREGEYPNYTLINDGSNSVEDRLGAIGDINLAIKRENIDEDLIIVGGDNFFGFNLQEFIHFAQAKRPYNSVCLYEHTTNHLDLTQFGIVQLNNADQIIDFQEKPLTPKSNLISTCIYYFSKERLILIPRYLELGNQKDTPGSFISWLVENDIVYGKTFKESWFDLGDFDALSEAVIQLNENKL